MNCRAKLVDHSEMNAFQFRLIHFLGMTLFNSLRKIRYIRYKQFDRRWSRITISLRDLFQFNLTYYLSGGMKYSK